MLKTIYFEEAQKKVTKNIIYFYIRPHKVSCVFLVSKVQIIARLVTKIKPYTFYRAFIIQILSHLLLYAILLK